jgi:pyrimidine-nucleoside phosphorylase
MLMLGGKATDVNSGLTMAMEALSSGAAWQKLKELVEAQEGDVRHVEDPGLLPQARLVEPVSAPRSGYLAAVDAAEVGRVVTDLGGGRKRKGDPIDHSVGLIVHFKVGDLVEVDTPLLTIHANDEKKLESARERLLRAHVLSDVPVQRLPPFYRRITEA